MKRTMPWVVVAGCLAMAGMSRGTFAAEGGLQESAERWVGALALAVDEEIGASTGRLSDTVSQALKQADDAFSRAAEVGRQLALRFRDGGQPKTFVLPGAAMTAETADRLGEDLAVMSRILDKAVSREGEALRQFLGGRLGGLGGRDLDALYLDGFGAVFLMNVGFPLVAPEPVRSEKAVGGGDRLWEETRKELQGKAGGNEDRGGDRGVAFDPTLVEAFRQRVIEVLPHATNLRGLGTNDWVVVSAFAPDASAAVHAAFSPDGRKLAVSGSEGTVHVWDLATGEPVTSARRRNSVMTFRVRKGDIDAIASGAIAPEVFATKVSVSVR